MDIIKNFPTAEYMRECTQASKKLDEITLEKIKGKIWKTAENGYCYCEIDIIGNREKAELIESFLTDKNYGVRIGEVVDFKGNTLIDRFVLMIDW